MSNLNQKMEKTENYQPQEIPTIITAAEKNATKKYEQYKNIELRMSYIELEESLKFAGIPYSQYPEFKNIEKFHNDYKQDLMDNYAPYTEIGYSGTYQDDDKWEYIFGCQVRSNKDLSKDLIYFDTEMKRFAEISFRASSVGELVGGSDGPGDAMQTATEYIKEVWLPKHMDEVCMVYVNHLCFQVPTSSRPHQCNMIEVYKVELDQDAVMSYYIPLK